MLKATRLGRSGTYITRFNLVETPLSSPARFPPRTLGSVATGRSIYSGIRDSKSTLKPGDPSYERIDISELWGKYRLGKSDSTIDRSKTKEDDATVAFESEIYKLASGFTESATVDVGDPLGCDSVEMRSAKARSPYAWVRTAGPLTSLLPELTLPSSRLRARQNSRDIFFKLKTLPTSLSSGTREVSISDTISATPPLSQPRRSINHSIATSINTGSDSSPR